MTIDATAVATNLGGFFGAAGDNAAPACAAGGRRAAVLPLRARDLDASAGRVGIVSRRGGAARGVCHIRGVGGLRAWRTRLRPVLARKRHPTVRPRTVTRCHL